MGKFIMALLMVWQGNLNLKLDTIPIKTNFPIFQFSIIPLFQVINSLQNFINGFLMNSKERIL